MQFLLSYLSELWHLTREMAPYLLFGFLAAGVLKVYFPRQLLVKYMGGNTARSSFNASLLGVPMPLCSCGVLPAGISLHNNGASKSATTSFLISTPQTGVDSILVTYAMLGLPMAIIRPVVALLTGFAGGVAAGKVENESDNKVVRATEEHIPRSFGYMLRYAFVDFMGDISRWLVYGLLIAALIAVLVPNDFFASTVSNPGLQMLLVLVASIPVYVCATGSVPIAAVLMLKGISPGAVLVFLMAGPATNAASLTVLHKALGRKTTIVYLVTIVLGALVSGFIVNLLPSAWFEVLGSGHHHHQHGILPDWIAVGSGILLIILIFNSLFNQFREKTKHQNTPMEAKKLLVKVEGMSCNHCARSIESNLRSLDQVTDVQASFERNEVLIEGDHINLEQVKSIVETLGYSYIGVKGQSESIERPK
ncbi:MAG TPA: permease [Bacteroidales bacterium]|nr:permease [Bacteroidales bacterium]